MHFFITSYISCWEVIKGDKKEVHRMTEEKITQINAKLNPEYDSEIIEEIRKIPRRDRSRTYREALLFYFRHQRKIEEN